MRACASRLRGARAQVSLEFLLLFAASMAFLSVWLSLILSVDDGIGESIAFSRLRAVSSDIREASDAVCLMGPGSTRTITAGMGLEIELHGRELGVSCDGMHFKETLRCDTHRESFTLSKNEELLIKNEMGKVDLSPPN